MNVIYNRLITNAIQDRFQKLGLVNVIEICRHTRRHIRDRPPSREPFETTLGRPERMNGDIA
jgi:hypothetical protein